MTEETLVERAEKAGWSFMAIYYNKKHPDLWFAEYYKNQSEYFDAKRFWARKNSKGVYNVKRFYDLKA